MSWYKSNSPHKASVSFWFPCVFVGWCLAINSPLVAQGERDERLAKLLQTLKDVDSVYLARCTYELEEKYRSEYDKIWTQPIISKCVLTIDSKTHRKALIKEVASDPLPDAEAVLSLDVGARRKGGGLIPVGSPQSVSVDSLGNRIIFFRTAHVSRFDNQISGAMGTLSRFVISPSKQVSKGDAHNFLHLNSATSIQLTHEEWRLRLITGRGYSTVLEEIKAYQELPNGLVDISAKCFQSQNAGTWDLVIDPGSSHLVRRARYTRVDEEQPIVKVDTEGTITKGSFSMPKTTTWEDHYVGTFTAQYVFKEGRFEFDEAAYRRAEEVVRSAEPYLPGTLISDGRVDPEENFVADADGKKPPRRNPREGVADSASWPWLVTGNVVVCALLAGAYLLKRRSRKKEASA